MFVFDSKFINDNYIALFLTPSDIHTFWKINESAFKVEFLKLRN